MMAEYGNVCSVLRFEEGHDDAFLALVERGLRHDYEMTRRAHPELPPWSVAFMWKMPDPVYGAQPGLEYWAWKVTVDA